MLQVRRLAAGEGTLLRTVRRRALADAPDAFVETDAEAARVPEAEWRERAARAGAALEEVVIVGLRDGEPVGMAGGRWREADAGLAGVWGMWVDPTARRSGLGRRLVDGVADWARAAGGHRLRLGVMADQTGSVAFYTRLGFVREGSPRPLRRDPARLWVEMSRAL